MITRRARGRARRAAEEWSRFGDLDPYYGVLSQERFRRSHLDDASREAFFRSGQEQIAETVAHLSRLFGRAPGHSRALDYGCGVGRLLIPLARRNQQAVGVDVSPGMRAEARRECDRRQLTNVQLIDATELHGLDPDFNLITSFIVLQHIPPAAGYEAILRLAGLLAPGGMAAVHVTLTPGSRLAYPFYWSLRSLPGALHAWNRIRGRARDHPLMEMNGYRLERILAKLASRGITECVVSYVPAPTGVSSSTVFSQATLMFTRPG